MSQHPLNLALRFLLELCILVALGYWGWTRDIGAWRNLLAVVLPVAAAILWGTFRWPHETAGSPRSPVPIPGWLRLLMEVVLFALAIWGLHEAGATLASAVFALVTLFHYAISYDRVLVMIRPQTRT